ncbi:DEAD/DEAH box helicase [Flavobacterium sp. LS1P28]|uniref:DEAD/DEAH box helicase family protein n=1 Tax=Flavobacterium sp. LS1P28 TaxID=2497752 RepID=UPI000F83C90E|nr:DEAD/DEAH box helicase family protein [Flavobacterium sp. LS1P28]RTY77741.1 DEAD/DEAH box helicase [Flavobacterium sp. LS1P28]
MIQTKLPVELQITKYISEQKNQILQLIDVNHRILLQANPGSGKTYFFEEIAKDIISGKRKGRLIFVAPFLIITEQFANKVNVNLQLKYDSRKELFPTDKIITSTFQSLRHVSNELDKDDIIVIDEAHALFYSYPKTNNDRQFYLSTIQDLYHTKAKVVLMSGTPNLSLVSTLRLHHIKIAKSNEIKAKININFSKSQNIDIARDFAVNAINQYGKKSLNIIYIKSIIQCNNICDMLISLGYTAKVLTSFEKNESTYKSISDIELVPKGIQFIVTTNVISTGANIKNWTC